MLEELLRDQNRTLTELTGEVGAVKSTLKQYETTFEKINLQISAINQNINNNNITIAKATGFVSAVAFIISTATTLLLHHFKIT